MTDVNDYKVLTRLEPTDNPAIQEMIQRQGLSVFVSAAFAIYYRRVTSADRSYRRSLQELVALVTREAGTTPVSYPVGQAQWESFEAWRASGAGKAVAQGKREQPEEVSNEKIEQLFESMIEMGASDIHISAREHDGVTRVRMRIHGILSLYAVWTYEIGVTTVRAIWLHYCRHNRREGGINNGSFYLRPALDPDKAYMIRMSEAPEARGLIFVARIRDPAEIRPLDDMGYLDQQLNDIKSLLTLRKGLICVSGPTNSGKSTTQSSMLSCLPASLKIIEIGDPVETYLEHVDHLELRENYPGGKTAHLDDYLGTTVRQDVDLLAMTEMRDPLTSRAAVQMASQGKLVLTTMHTTDFVSAVGRLLALDIAEADILAPGFLRALISQNLLAKLCPECSLEQSPRPHESKRYEFLLAGPEKKHSMRYLNPEGCENCRNTGIVDRVLVAEVVEITPAMIEIVRKILEDKTPHAYHEWAESTGTLNMHQHARQRILRGEVDPGIAESELGRFDETNLLWMHPSRRRAEMRVVP